MRHATQPPDRAATTQLEGLLRSAATYAVPAEPPEDLATRALARWQTRRTQRGRRLRAGLVIAALLGGAVSLARLHSGNATTHDRMAVVPPGTPIAGHEPRPSREPGQVDPVRDQHPWHREPSGSAALVRHGSPSQNAAQARRSTRDVSPRTVAIHREERSSAPLRVARAEPPYHPAPHRRREPPKAHWDTQVVQRDVTGVLAPVWLVQANEDRGEILLTPGLLQIEAKPDVTEAESWNAAPTSQPALPESDYR